MELSADSEMSQFSIGPDEFPTPKHQCEVSFLA